VINNKKNGIYIEIFLYFVINKILNFGKDTYKKIILIKKSLPVISLFCILEIKVFFMLAEMA
jgi:hypothetical protein